jgi:Tol biopolymer transport system component
MDLFELTRGLYRLLKTLLLITLSILTCAAVSAKPENRLTLNSDGMLRYSVNRGTGLSVDLSPDGQTILFDMLGDIYILPIGGGTARQLTSGMAWDAFPRFAPDGSQIAFISDRNGLDNLWVMDADGRHPHMVSNNRNVMDEDTPYYVRGTAWSADGREIAVRRKRLRNTYSNDELWLYDVASGLGHAFVGSGRTVDEAAGPTGTAFTHDGRGLIFSTRNPWERTVKWTSLWYLDRRSLTRSRLIESPALLSSPTLSPDDTTLAYLAASQDENGFGQIDLRRCKLSVGEDGAAHCNGDALLASNLGTMRGNSSAWWTWPQAAVFASDGKSLL